MDIQAMLKQFINVDNFSTLYIEKARGIWFTELHI